MLCPKCGVDLPSNAHFCLDCGSPMKEAETTESPPSRQSPEPTEVKEKNWIWRIATLLIFLCLLYIPFSWVKGGANGGTQKASSAGTQTMPNETTKVPPEKLSSNDIAEAMKRCTVKIEIYFKETDALFDDEYGGEGSGVIIEDKDGVYLIATNSHVWGLDAMREADDDQQPEIATYAIQVTFWDGKKTNPIALVDHPSQDCAIIIVSGKVGSYPSAKLADDLPSTGETVYAMGHPLGLEYSFTRGMVSAIRDDSSDAANPFRHIQTDTPISPGNSGGPLVNERGFLVGLNTYSRTLLSHR